MTRFFTCMAATLLVSSFTLFSGMDEVITDMKTGNSAQLAKYFDNTIEITMPDKSNTYSKPQAELVLKDFFTTNPVKNFEVIHMGENGGSQFCIGSLITKNGTYRTTIFMKQRGDKQLLQEIRFVTN